MIKNQANAASLAKVFLQWNNNPVLEELVTPDELDKVAEKYELLIVALLTKTLRLNVKILEESVRFSFPKLSNSLGIQFIRSLVDVVKMARECSKHMTSGKRQSQATKRIVQTILKANNHFRTAEASLHFGKHKVAAKWAHSPNSKASSRSSESSNCNSMGSCVSAASHLKGSRSMSSLQSDTQEIIEEPASTNNRLLALYGLQNEGVSNIAIELSSQETVPCEPYDQFWDSHKLTMVRIYSNGIQEEAETFQGPDGFVIARFADGADIKTECPNALLLLPIAMKRPSKKQKDESRRSPSLSSSTSGEKNHAAESASKKSNKATHENPRKRPAAMSTSTQQMEKPQNAAELRPHGCKRCRGRVGCTPSCWRLNTKPSMP
jgi:hypothetical protein